MVSGDTIPFGAQANGSLGYFLAIYGPASIEVPVIISGSILSQAVSSGAASGTISTGSIRFGGYDTLVSGPGRLDVTCGSANGSPENGCGIAAFTSHIETLAFSDFGTGHGLGVLMQVSSSSSATNFLYNDQPEIVGSSDGSILADPHFEIDPTWLTDHPGYAIAFSDGVENGAALPSGVPEPSAWALMIAGFGLAGAALRRRRTAAAA